MAIPHDMDERTPLPHLHTAIEAQLTRGGVLPELVTALRRIANADGQRQDRSARWGWLIPTLQHMLGDTDHLARPFAEAWYLLNAATGRLDDVQDGDPTEDPLPFASPAVQYQLILSYYVLAQGLLDQLDATALPAPRIAALRHLWSRMVLRAASGQFRDLLAGTSPSPTDPAAHYQALAQAKSGAIFALAFGGTATLLSDDTALVQTFTLIGECFGTLLQFTDDTLDKDGQPNTTLTLPHVYATAFEDLPPNRSFAHYATYIYQAYRAHLMALIEHLPMSYQAPLAMLIDQVFRVPAEASR
jgi:geranylgeranyl pyrophosphate synthase